jgi:predicted Zn finger-like uncharacterized protein
VAPETAMLIVCPNCSTSYAIEPTSLGSVGRTVRCARCKRTWFADGAKPEPELTAVDAGTAAEETFTGVLRPDHPVNSSGVEVEHRPAGDEAGNSSVTQEHPAAAETPATVVDAPSVVPSIEPSANSPGEADADEIENFAARRKRLQARRKQARHSSRWTALILVLFAFNVALVGARSEVVRFFPQTASLFAAVGLPVNLRNLKFENMRISKEAQEGLSSLIVEGTIVSVTNRPVEVPRLRFAARDTAGQEVYTWTALPGRSILGPGEKLDFRSRFVSPPDNAVDVIVRFAGAQDALPGAK